MHKSMLYHIEKAKYHYRVVLLIKRGGVTHMMTEKKRNRLEDSNLLEIKLRLLVQFYN